VLGLGREGGAALRMSRCESSECGATVNIPVYTINIATSSLTQ
jgi:hypothetical protein